MKEQSEGFAYCSLLYNIQPSELFNYYSIDSEFQRTSQAKKNMQNLAKMAYNNLTKPSVRTAIQPPYLLMKKNALPQMNDVFTQKEISTLLKY